MRWRRGGRSRAGLGVGTVLLGLVAAGQAGAQVPGPTLDDGTYTGVASIGGTFGFDLEQAGASGGMTWSGQARGPATLVIEEGVASGSWALSGHGTIDGSFAADGAAITVEGTQEVLEASGPFDGQAGAYRMTGTSRQVVMLTAQVPVIGARTTTQTTEDPVDAPLHDLLFTCNTLTGRFDHDVRQDLQEIGFHESIVGSIALVREPHSDETLEELEELGEILQDALSGVHAPDELDRVFAISELTHAIQGAAEVAMTLHEPNPCPASQQGYLELAADIVRRAVEALLAVDERGEIEIPVSVWWDAVIGITATGLAGTPEGEDLLQSTRAVIERRWTDLVTDPDTDLITPDPEMVEIIVMSAVFFWDLPVGDERMPASELMLLHGE